MTKIDPRTSQWRAQLGALGLDSVAATEPEARAEAALMARMKLPALELPPRRPWRHHKTWLAAAAAAVVALVVVLQIPRDDTLRMKGNGDVAVYWERNGLVHRLGEDGPLQSGDRVRAEVQMPDAGVAYLAVVDRQQKALVDAAFVAASALPLKAGERKAFAQSLRLDGEAVGEAVVVIFCKGDGLDEASIAVMLNTWQVPERCAKTSIGLR